MQEQNLLHMGSKGAKGPGSSMQYHGLPPPSVVPCDRNKRKRLVYSKLMGRTIPDYFKMSTEEQQRELNDREEDWFGSSGDQDFFVRASDDVLASWEEVLSWAVVNSKGSRMV